MIFDSTLVGLFVLLTLPAVVHCIVYTIELLTLCFLYPGNLIVPPNAVQDHGCTDEAIYSLWHNPSEPVSVRVTTKSIRIKRSSTKEVLFEFPLFHVSYCGTNSKHKDAFAFVAKSTTDSPFNCYVFKCADAEKAYTLTLTVSKAFYIAYEILQAEQGMFHETPPRDTVFEPQHDTDTKTSPQRPIIDVPDIAARNIPVIQLRTSSGSSEDGIEHVSLSSADEDFIRLAKARSNPNILRSTLDHSTVTECNVAALRLYSEPGSAQPTPASSTSNLAEPFD